ncbi:MAG: archease [Bacillota bacterium]
MEGGYHLIDHTADLGLVARGRDLGEALAQAASGLFDLLWDRDNVLAEVEMVVVGEGPDLETAVVGWLNEILYLHQVEEWVFASVRRVECRSGRIASLLVGERLRNHHRRKREIKAVTYHGIRVCQKEMWEVAFIVDV